MTPFGQAFNARKIAACVAIVQHWSKSSGEIQVVAGVQAMCKKGEMLRQMSVTRNSLTMVRMPPRSHRVLVTRATAIDVKASAPSSD